MKRTRRDVDILVVNTRLMPFAAYQKALASSGLSAKIRENKKGDKPLRVMAAVDKTTDLGPFGKAVMTAVPTKPGQMPPAQPYLLTAFGEP